MIYGTHLLEESSLHVSEMVDHYSFLNKESSYATP